MLGQAEINEIRARLRAMALAARGLVRSNDTAFNFAGHIRIREVPFETREEFEKWWLPERNSSGVIVARARMSEHDKDRYTALEARNLLTSNGRTQILGFIGTPTYISSQTPFAQWFEVGTYPFTKPSAGDSTVPGALARVTPSSAIVTGTQIDISNFFASGAANGTWTNAGLWGNNATATLGSGTLMTHSAFAYPKTAANSITTDYLINLT